MSFLVGIASCGALIVLLHGRPASDPPERWLRVELIFGEWRNLRTLALGPAYASRRGCEHRLPPIGYETVGRVTTYRRYECVRIAQ